MHGTDLQIGRNADPLADRLDREHLLLLRGIGDACEA